MTKDHGPSVKDDARYEKLRAHGYSKEKSARIANTYQDQNRAQLYDKAKDVGIPGRSRMSKAQLIDALRHH